MLKRRGVTLVEVSIVVAIIGILAGIGAGMITETIPSWRTRRAAMDMSAAVSEARARAISDNVQYRVWVVDTDADIESDGANVGEYYVQRGDSATGSSNWDTLPVDLNASDSNQGEGYVNLQDGAEDSLPGVSFVAMNPGLGAVDSVSDSLVFNPRGQVDNSSDDFACDVNGDGQVDGYVCFTFANKKAAQKGRTDQWTVIVSRAGMARIVHNTDLGGFASGVAITSSPGGSSQGYAGGSTGSSGDDGSGDDASSVDTGSIYAE